MEICVAGRRLRTRPACRGREKSGSPIDEPHLLANDQEPGGGDLRCRQLDPDQADMPRRGRAWRLSMSRSSWPQPGSRAESCFAGSRLPARTRMPRRGSAWRLSMSSSWPQPGARVEICVAGRRLRTRPACRGREKSGSPIDEPHLLANDQEPGGGDLRCRQLDPDQADMPRRGIPAPADEQQQLATARVPGGELLRRRAAPGPNQDAAAGERPSMSCSSWPQPGSRAESCFAGSRLPDRTRMPWRGIPAPADESQQVATARSAGGEQRRRRAAPGPNQMPWRGIPAPADEQQQVATARSAGGEQRRRRAAPGPNQDAVAGDPGARR
ncbi:hypothetical protein QO009_004105 [Brevibacillus aydinogluensis]|nr:hypothetical protein [Brevibacillus aydinogluensis]